MKKTASGLIVPVDYNVKSQPASKVRVVRSRYDSAQTSIDNTRHWTLADALSPDASNNAGVRRTLRNRARYECANNSYARGMVNTIANDTIGTTPRLQMLTMDEKGNEIVENEYSAWAEEINLAEKLRTLRKAKCVDGEAFAIFVNNPKLKSRVKLDIRIIEADMVTSPLTALTSIDDTDGIEFDQYGNRMFYHVLKEHPGGGQYTSLLKTDKYKADMVMHWYRMDRSGQTRGIPEITPALPLFAQLRRYTLAVIAAAETAADFAAVLEATGPAVVSDSSVESMDVIELEKRMATVLPQGWKLSQVDAKQPSTAYAEFKHEILNEIARCMLVPYNIAAGNSEDYNYASGRMDHQVYYKSISVERYGLKTTILNPILQAWKNEAILISDYLPVSWRTIKWDCDWFFDGHEHVDPKKEADAQDVHLSNLSTTYAAEYAKQGKDWRKELEQVAKEKALMQELGINTKDVEQKLSKGKTDGE